MKKHIIHDSEEEDEEEFLVPVENVASKPSQQSTNSWMVAEAEEILADNPSQGLDGTVEEADHSSLSTGDLQRQIADASRGLFDSTLSRATTKQPSMASSSAKNARRHSAVVGSGSSAKVVKRTKTAATTTYGSSKPSNPRFTNTGQFDAFRDEELPGTLQANFANHEHTVMFRNTGNSTIVDNESSQQRMVEQTINHSKQLPDWTETKLVDSDKPDSSPFPWTASSIATQTPGGNTSKQSPHDTIVAHKQAEIEAEQNATCASNSGGSQSGIACDTEFVVQQEVPGHIRPVSSHPIVNNVLLDHAVSREQSSASNPANDDEVAPSETHLFEVRQPLKSSPQVSVPRVRVKSTTQTGSRPAEALKGRKRKASTADLELNSDERAIGHPKELYQPRLSRRRATGLLEQPNDFSVVPERAVKKRRKTANTASATPDTAEDELAHDPTAAPQAQAMPSTNKSGDFAANTIGPAAVAKAVEVMEEPQPDRLEIRAHLKKLNFPLTATSPEAGKSESLSPTKDASPLSAKKQPTAAAVSMGPPTSSSVSTSKSPTKKWSKAAAASAMPPPTSSVTRTSRRSHTTIFEDHVDFGGSQRSPSLRQQQAIRKSAALKEVKNVSTQATRRKRRSVVQDDDDDDDDEEDELVKDPAVEVSIPKKRGRPAKAPPAQKPAPKERVLEDSDAETADEEIVEPPKKKGRPTKAPAGKSLKSAEKVLDDSEDEFDEHEIEVEEPPKKRGGRRPSKSKAGELSNSGAATKAAVGAEHATAETTESGHVADAASKLPATSPSDQQTPGLTKQDVAPKATVQGKPAHSPIKPSSKVLHRVGLNRRQRVQPLLKIVRPPAPSRPR